MSPFTIEINDLEAPSLSDERATIPPYDNREWTYAPEEEQPDGPFGPTEGA